MDRPLVDFFFFALVLGLDVGFALAAIFRFGATVAVDTDVDVDDIFLLEERFFFFTFFNLVVDFFVGVVVVEKEDSDDDDADVDASLRNTGVTFVLGAVRVLVSSRILRVLMRLELHLKRAEE